MQGTQGQVVRLPHLAGSNSSNATNISDDGFTIVGYADGSGSRCGWYWNAVDGTVEVPKLPGYSQCEIYDCSADGSVVVGKCRVDDASGDEMPILWSVATGTIGLSAGNTDNPGNTAFGISADGTRVIGRRDALIASGGWLWTEATGAIELEIPPDPLGADTHPCYPDCISGDGSVIGGQYDRFVGGVQTLPPVIWDGTDGSLISVLTLPGGWANAAITGFSYDGSFAVGLRSLQYASGNVCDVSRHGKTIVGRAVDIFTWSGGSSITALNPNSSFRLPTGGAPASLARGMPLTDFRLMTAGNGLVYASTVLDLSNPANSQAVRVSMLA